MILLESELERAVKAGVVTGIDRKSQIQPASIDLRLSDDIKIPRQNMPLKFMVLKAHQHILRPGEFVLGSTIEKVSLPNWLVGRVEGKSSLGRSGILTHVTAGFIDPGFVGNITLEIVNVSPWAFHLQSGMMICQLSLYLGHGETTGYIGTYANDSHGTVPPNLARIYASE